MGRPQGKAIPVVIDEILNHNYPMTIGIKRNRILRIIIICQVIVIFSYKGLPAHPHAFIVQRIKMVFDDQGLAGFKIRWDFDDMFTSMIAGDYDKDKNGSLEPAEVTAIKEKAFSYLANQDYFTFIKINEKPFKVSSVKDFSAKLTEDKRLIYEFFVPCHVSASSNMKQVIVASYDPTYYSAIYYANKNPAAIVQGERYEIKSAIREDESTPIYFGMVYPWALFLDFSLKP